MRKSRAIALGVILVATLAPIPAGARAGCAVSVLGGLQFGQYDPFAHGHRDAFFRIRVDCPAGVAPQIAISKGNSPSYATRELRSGHDVLRYNLYLDPGRQVVWGDGTEGSRALQASGNAQATVYARIPAGQDVAAGSYSDTIVITVFL